MNKAAWRTIFRLVLVAALLAASLIVAHRPARAADSPARAADSPARAADSPARAAPSDEALVASARREGRVVWYTTQIVSQLARPMVAAFEAAYGVKVEFLRGSANDQVLRLLAEAGAGRMQADVFETTGQFRALKERGVVAPWLSPGETRFAPPLVDPAGYWVATNLFVLTPGLNTAAVPLAEAPRTFDDLLDPRWKGRIMWNVNPTLSGAPGFVGLALTTMGEDRGRAYLQRLATQGIIGSAGSAREVLDQVIAGEADLALNIFNTNAVISAEKGAPVQWLPMQPALAGMSVVAVTRDAPHPAAARLFARFLVSPAGQQVYRDANYIPADPAVPPRDPSVRPDGTAFKAVFLTPDAVDAALPRWVALTKELFAE